MQNIMDMIVNAVERREYKTVTTVIDISHTTLVTFSIFGNIYIHAASKKN